MSNNTALIKLVDSDALPVFKKMDEFLKLVNVDAPNSWVKDHPTAKGVKYLPIDKVELLLAKLFQQTRVEILREGQLLNSVYVTLRLHYKHPVTGSWEFQDGTGAVGVQTDKDARASDMTAIKSDAVMKALPAAESYALKDAAEKIGRIFGKDLNRKDVAAFTPSFSGGSTSDTIDDLMEQFKQATTPKEIEALLSGLTADQKRVFTPVAQNRLKEIQNGTSS